MQREYESALLALVRAESQLQVAEFSRDFDARKTLQQEVERLTVGRHALRTALRDHEASAHESGKHPQASSA